MDWEQLREKTLGEVGTALVTEGGGVAGGFVGAAFVGRQFQNWIKPDSGVVSFTDAAMAWAANNVPKLAVWYLTRSYAIEPGETVTPVKEAISDARKAFAGSVVFDTLMRLSNSGKNPASASIMGWQVLGSGESPEVQKSAQADVQRLIQENSALRAELNKALQRLATQPIAPPAQSATQPATQVVVQPAAPPVVRYTPVTPYSVPPAPMPAPAPVVRAPPVARAEEIVAQPVPPVVQERQRRYGFMQPPPVQQRQRKYGFMAGEEKDIATMFGML